jgi:hypothetical protein
MKLKKVPLMCRADSFIICHQLVYAMLEKYHSQRDLLGRVFEHEWTNGKYGGVIYQVEFLSETELRWTGIAGFPKGRSDTQNYRVAKIDDDICQFSWLAKDGLSVIVTYNFDKMRAFGVVSDDKGQNVLSGILKLIK